jgi:hypothetical protein
MHAFDTKDMRLERKSKVVADIRAVRFQKFYPGSGFFGTEKPRFGSVSVIFKKKNSTNV